MTTPETERDSAPEEDEVTLSEIAQMLKELKELKEALKSQAETASQAREGGSEATRAQLAQESKDLLVLRQEILYNLLQKGPALPIELAAATLSLPEEIQPVLDMMQKEGVIEIRETGRGRLVTLTARGRDEARRTTSSSIAQQSSFR